MLALFCCVSCLVISSRGLQFLLLSAIWLMVSAVSPYFGTFVIGVGLAAVHARNPDKTWPAWSGGALLLPLLLLYGYHENFASGLAEGCYAFLNPLATLDPLLFRVTVHSLAAALTILLLLRHRQLGAALSGSAGRLLGFMSFPIYLTQIIVICSLSSWAYVALGELSHGWKLLICFIVTIAGAAIFAVPIAYLDRWWVGVLGRFVNARSERLRTKIKLRSRVLSS